MSDYQDICDITGNEGTEAIDTMIYMSSKDIKKHIINSSYSPTQIANEFEHINTAIELNRILKTLYILEIDGNINPLLEHYNLVIYKEGIDKKTKKKYIQQRWTTIGKEYIIKALKQYTTVIEPLVITSTNVKQSQHPKFNHYYLEVKDQYGRCWSYRSANEKPTLEEISDIEKKELISVVIDIEKYYIHFSNDEKIINPNRHEEILYVYTYDINSREYGNNYIETKDKYEGYVLVITKDLLEYQHNKKFNSYTEIEKFALKIKKSAIVNLKFWDCNGEYQDWDNNIHLEFEEQHDHTDDDSNYMMQFYDADLDNGMGTYLSDGAYIKSDGSIYYDK